MRLLVILTLLAGLLLPVSLNVRAQNDPPLETVRAWLAEQLHRDFALLEYTFEGATWPDSGLGCPVAGETYTEGEIVGYRWAFLADDGVRYAVHTNQDGSQAVLCTDLSAVTFSLTAYTNTYFTISHPDNWTPQVFEDVEVNFALRGQLDCALPGMQVRVVPNASPDTLLNEHLFTLDNPTNLSGYAPIAQTGLTFTYETVCTGSEIPRTWRVTALPGTADTAMLILQWSPNRIYAIWSPTFVSLVNSAELRAGTLAASATPTPEITATPAGIAPPPTTVPTVVPSPTIPVLPSPPPAPALNMATLPLLHVFIGDVYVGRSNALPGLPLTFDGLNTPRQHIRPSPDGSQVAFVENSTRLMLAPLNPPGGVETVVEGLAPGLPPAWSWEGGRLAFAAATDTDGQIEMRVREADGSITVLGNLPYDPNCPTASGYRVDELQRQEGEAFMAWLPDGRLLYTPTCTGQGVNLWTPSAQIGGFITLGADLRGLALSPDGGRLAVIAEAEIQVIQLATLESTTLTPQRPPVLLAWDITGTQIFYASTRAEVSAIWDDESTRARAESVLGVFPFESRLNTLFIQQIDVNNRGEIPRWQGTGFAVGRIIGSPDGTGLFFTLIPSDRDWLTAFTSAENTSPLVISRPETQFYWLPNSENPEELGVARLLAVTAQPVFVLPRP